jgi:ribosomal protein L20A (L18A)
MSRVCHKNILLKIFIFINFSKHRLHKEKVAIDYTATLNKHEDIKRESIKNFFHILLY